jgi:copper transport protein
MPGMGAWPPADGRGTPPPSLPGVVAVSRHRIGMTLLRRSLVIGAGVFLALLPSVPALAHAALVDSHPADGSHLDSSPDVVRLVFNEPVELPPAAVRVFDSTGRRVDRGDVRRGPGPNEVTVSVPELPDGAYVVTWQVISADSHPVRGALVFQVGHGAEQVDDSLIASLLGHTRSVGLSTAAWVLRWVTYLSVLVVVGAVVFLLAVRPPRQGRIRGTVRWAAVLGVLASLAQIPVLAAETSGLGWAALVSMPALSAAMGSSLALASGVRSMSLVAMSLALGSSRRSWAVVGVAGAVGVVTAELLTGHTRTATPAVPMNAAAAIHVLAAAVWVGGLVALWVSLREARVDDDLDEGARVLGRFSVLALWSVAVLSLAGLVLAWIQVGTWPALTSTRYGVTLVAKSVLAAAVIGVAAYNNRVLVPAIVGKSGAGGVGGDDGAWNRLTRTVRLEMAGLLMVMGATALLVNLPPAARDVDSQVPYSVSAPFGDLLLEMVVDPGRAGDNEIHIYITTPGGLSPVLSGNFTMEMSLPSEGVGPIVRVLTPVGPAHFLHVGPELAIPGNWVVTIRNRVSQSEAVVTELPVVVRP